MILFLLLFFIIIMPLILNYLYNSDAPLNFFQVGYSISDILSYYGSVLTFIGTVSLGVITVYQNYISQQKTNEINKLTLELQKKNMAMAEQRYGVERENEINRNTPKFELKNRGCNGHYMNLQAELKNVSNIIVSGIKSITLEVFDENNVIVTTSDKVKIKESSLLSGDKTTIEFHNNALKSEKVKSAFGQNSHSDLKAFTMIWKFQCEDQLGNIHYYRANFYIKVSNEYKGDFWDVQKVG